VLTDGLLNHRTDGAERTKVSRAFLIFIVSVQDDPHNFPESVHARDCWFGDGLYPGSRCKHLLF